MELIAYLLSSMGLTVLVIWATGGLGFTAPSLPRDDFIVNSILRPCYGRVCRNINP